MDVSKVEQFSPHAISPLIDPHSYMYYVKCIPFLLLLLTTSIYLYLTSTLTMVHFFAGMCLGSFTIVSPAGLVN